MNGTLKERAYSYIYEKLASGELEPGERLSGRALAKEIGVSPIPVRDAIIQLRNEGFIVAHEDGRTFVPEPSYEQLMDIYDQREALECHAVARVAELPDETFLTSLDTCIGKLAEILDRLEAVQDSERHHSLDLWAQADAEFHDTLVQGAGNRLTLDTVRNLRTRTRIFGKQIRFEPLKSLQRSHREHIQIRDSIRAGNATDARLAMQEHIRQGCRQVIEAHHRKGMNSHRT